MMLKTLAILTTLGLTSASPVHPSHLSHEARAIQSLPCPGLLQLNKSLTTLLQTTSTTQSPEDLAYLTNMRNLVNEVSTNNNCPTSGSMSMPTSTLQTRQSETLCTAIDTILQALCSLPEGTARDRLEEAINSMVTTLGCTARPQCSSSSSTSTAGGEFMTLPTDRATTVSTARLQTRQTEEVCTAINTLAQGICSLPPGAARDGLQTALNTAITALGCEAPAPCEEESPEPEPEPEPSADRGDVRGD